MRYPTVSQSRVGPTNPVTAATSAVDRVGSSPGWAHCVAFTAAGGTWPGGNEARV